MEKVCIKCNDTFTNVAPNNTYVDIRSRKYCWTCKPYNSSNNKVLEERTEKECNRCHKVLPIEAFYSKTATGLRTKVTYCIGCMIEYNKERELKIKIVLLTLRGGCCSVCGYNKNVFALDFHHRNPEEKEFNLAHISGITKAVLDEIEKCDILCSNCHREHHYPRANNLL